MGFKNFSSETVGKATDNQQVEPPHIAPLEETLNLEGAKEFVAEAVAEKETPKPRRKSPVKKVVDAVKSKVTAKKK